MTELVSGLDIVQEQFRLAAGAPLSARAVAAADRAARPTSHAIEVRISAEDPARVFAPAPGRISRWVMPAGPGVRVDTAVEVGDRVPPDYDPLICKLIVHAADRAEVLGRLRRALDEIEIGGVQTTLPFHRAMLAEPGFAGASELLPRRGSTRTGTAPRRVPRPCGPRSWPPAWPSSANGAGRVDRRSAMPAVPGASAAPGRSLVCRRRRGLAWRAAGRAVRRDRWPAMSPDHRRPRPP